MKSRLVPRKKVLFLLGLANIILLSAGWLMALHAFPRLPPRVMGWMNVLGQQNLLTEKSPLFFIYPITQTLFCLGYGYLLIFVGKTRVNTGQDISYIRLRQEFILLVLIFFNLIFIHLQRSIILSSHGLVEGISDTYFFSLFGIIIILIPYYRIRRRLITKKSSFPGDEKV